MNIYENAIYIIGNGFDKHHHLNTNYIDYKNYIKKYNYKLVDMFDYYLKLEKIEECDIFEWSELEDYLGLLCKIDIDEIWDDAFMSTEMDMDKATYWSDPMNNVKRMTNDRINIIKGIKYYFEGWIESIEKEIENISPDLNLLENSLYLNFNYTSTLEKLYKIPSMNILHIHGCHPDYYVLGHNLEKIFHFYLQKFHN